MRGTLLNYVVFKESCEVEGRIFLAGKEYPIHKRDNDYVTLHAENGAFNFSNRLMDKAIDDWDLKVKGV